MRRYLGFLKNESWRLWDLLDDQSFCVFDYLMNLSGIDLKGKYNWLATKAFNLIFRIGPKIHFGQNFSNYVLHYIHPHLYLDQWFAQPFNGQISRHLQILQIADCIKPDVTIETGTFLGTSTPFLAAMSSGQTFTIEYVPKYAERARRRFSTRFKNSGIVLIQGNSAQELEKLLDNIDPNSVILAYLDAHWERELPTAQELIHLMSWGSNWVAVIDDFKVPGDDSYGFDQYEDLIVDHTLLPAGVRLLVPSRPSEFETGARRGTAYVFGPTYETEDLTELFKRLREIELHIDEADTRNRA